MNVKIRSISSSKYPQMQPCACSKNKTQVAPALRMQSPLLKRPTTWCSRTCARGNCALAKEVHALLRALLQAVHQLLPQLLHQLRQPGQHKALYSSLRRILRTC